MERKAKQLEEKLDELITLLKSDGETHWSKWMSGAKNRIERRDAGGLDRILEAYGGMGSFNDLILGHRVVKGQFQFKAGANEMNLRLSQLRTDIYTLTKELRRASV